MSEQWFTEREEDTLRYSYRIREHLFQHQSPFQKVQVVDTHAYGHMLILDDVVQLTASDEFVYHEMIAHLPVCYHRDPKHVLIIGGGDGGTARELAKHPGIEKITVCEIDGTVIEAARSFFPELACGFDDPRVDLKVGDGIAFMQDQRDAFDVIIIDSSDPIGPGVGLFTKDFYANAARALKPGGIVSIQAESTWASEDLIRPIIANVRSAFPNLYPSLGPVPTYPRGHWCWLLATKEPLAPTDFATERFAAIRPSLQYLTVAGAQTIFDVPSFYRDRAGL